MEEIQLKCPENKIFKTQVLCLPFRHATNGELLDKDDKFEFRTITKPEIGFRNIISCKEVQDMGNDELLEQWEKAYQKVEGDDEIKQRKKHALYDINNSKLTVKQKKDLKFREEVLDIISQGGDYELLGRYFGRDKLKKIEKIMIEECLRKDHEPVKIILKKPLKVTSEVRENTMQIVDQKDFIGGYNQVQSTQKFHPDPMKRISLNSKTIKKMLKKTHTYKSIIVKDKDGNILKKLTDGKFVRKLSAMKISKDDPTKAMKKFIFYAFL